MHTQLATLWMAIILHYSYANLLNNGDFLDRTSWKLQVRKTLWDLDPAEQQYLHIGDCDQCENNKGLIFSKLGDKKALVASQYIPHGRIDTSDFGKLARIKAEIKNLRSMATYQLRLDISYEDGRYLFVNHQVLAAKQQHTCILIPQYGSIRAIMVHIVSEDNNEESIIIDRVSIETVQDIKPYIDCGAYIKSKPKRREILYDYLHPAVPLLNNNITLVTQFTEDRLDFFEETLKTWRGPATAALLIFQGKKNEILKRISERYQTSEYLSRYARLHVINEDLTMNEDSTKYPVNFLRKLVLNSTTSEYLFYVDVDISPSFSHDTALKWLQESNHLNHEQAAFIAPLFHSSKGDPPSPRTKQEVLQAINESKLESFAVTSHSAVKYHTWYKSDHIYEIQYRLNMEPYFITHKQAPLINEMFEGYGRDKCAYSKELHHAGFSFHVLPNAFLINRKESKKSKTILQRSPGVNLRVFLTTLFHDEDLRVGFLRYRQESVVMNKPATAEFCDAVSGECEPKHETENFYTEENNLNMTSFFDSINDNEEDDGGLSCRKLGQTTVDGELYPHQLNPMPNVRTYPERIAMTVESMLKYFAIGNFIHLPKQIDGQISLMIPYYHASKVVSVIPNTKKSTFQRDKSSLFTEYRSFLNSTSTLLTEVRRTIVDPSVYWIEMSGLKDHEAAGNLSAVLEYSTNNDIIILNGNSLKPTTLMRQMCTKKKSWKLYRNSPYYFMKSSYFTPPHPVIFSSLDVSALTIENGIINLVTCSSLKTDIVLFTKNRPLQSHAFIESLLQMVTGINKLWIIAHSNQIEISNGYEKLVDCFSHELNVELIFDHHDGFGRTFDGILRKSDADYIMMNVDEIVWLRPVDLKTATCLMDSLGEKVISFQLRLGENLQFANKKITNNQKILIGRLGDEEIYGLYPLWQPYDFSYVTQVDGPLISKQRLHDEMGPWLNETQHPGHVENRWLRRFLHKHARSWHLMYGKTRLVNNKVGDRVTGSELKESSRQLVNVYLEQHKAIDVEHFRMENLDHKHTHISVKVQYKDFKCA